MTIDGHGRTHRYLADPSTCTSTTLTSMTPTPSRPARTTRWLGQHYLISHEPSGDVDQGRQLPVGESTSQQL